MKNSTGLRFGKKVLSAFLAAIILFCSVDITTIAAEPYISEKQDAEIPDGTSDGTDAMAPEPTGVLEGSDISVHADNSLGRIFEEAMASDGSMSTVSETGSCVYAVKMNGTEATVSFQTVEDSQCKAVRHCIQTACLQLMLFCNCKSLSGNHWSWSFLRRGKKD